MRYIVAVVVTLFLGCEVTTRQIEACGKACGEKGIKNVTFDACECYDENSLPQSDGEKP